MSTLDLHALQEELLARWDDFTSDGLTVRPRDRRKRILEQRRLALVFGLAAHVHETARVLTPHFRLDETSPVVMPLVRSAYETALTCVWVCHAHDAPEAFGNEYTRQRKAIDKTMRESPDPWLRGLADSVAGADEPIIATDSDEQAKYFRARCTDLDGDARAYWAYRLMSGLSHPTIELVDHYVQANPDDVNRLAGFRATPSPLPGEASHAFTLMSMIWSARAVTSFAPNPQYRSFLRGAAKQLGTTADLSLANAYHARRARAARRQREASKGEGSR